MQEIPGAQDSLLIFQHRYFPYFDKGVGGERSVRLADCLTDAVQCANSSVAAYYYWP